MTDKELLDEVYKRLETLDDDNLVSIFNAAHNELTQRYLEDTNVHDRS